MRGRAVSNQVCLAEDLPIPAVIPNDALDARSNEKQRITFRRK